MLTADLAIVEYRSGRAAPDRLTRKAHRHYLDHAERMLAIYRGGAGRQRRQLHRQVEEVLADEPDCPVRRIAAFCKLLDDRSTYQADPAGQAASLRLAVFAAAAPLHPLVGEPDKLFEHGETATKARIAAGLGKSWAQVDCQLYSDVLAFQRLEAFAGYPDAAALLSRYNVAQLQAALYAAEELAIEAAADFKTILRYAKLARLLHEIEAAGPGRYRITLSGPATLLRQTRRYGADFARFLPALLACRGWRMSARLRTPWGGQAALALSDRDGFTSHLPPAEEFDSAVERAFAEKFGPERDGWRLVREGEILHDGQAVFVPDFAFRRADGTAVLLEIVGFWTPQYLARKRETIRRFRRHRILLAVPQRSLRKDAPLGEDVIVYKTALKVRPVLDALERVRRRAAAEAERP